MNAYQRTLNVKAVESVNVSPFLLPSKSGKNV